MDFLNNLTKSGEDKAAAEPKAADKPAGPGIIANAKGQAAGATADAIHAASDFSKVDKTQGVGKQADDAEKYLREVKASAAKE